MFLTAVGRELSEVVSTALGRIAEQSNRSRGGRAENEVVLFCQLCEAIYWLMPRLDGFHQQHPEIELKLLTSTRPLTEAQDRFDVAIQTSGRASGQYPLAFGVSEEVFPVCSKIYLSKCAEPATLDRLADHHLLHHKATPRDWIEWDDWLVRVGQTVRVGIHGTVFDSYPLMLQAAIEGHGIALGWGRSAEKLLQSGALVRPFTESAVLPGELCVYLRDHDAPGPAVAALLAWLTTALAQ